MAKIYKAPFDPPVVDYKDPVDWDAQQKIEGEYVKKLAIRCRANRTGSRYDRLLGLELRYGVADGYAIYMVWNIRPFSVIHVALGDAYRAHGLIEKGMDLQEALKQERQNKAWNKYMHRSEKA